MKSFIEKITGAISFRGLVFRAFIFGVGWLFLPLWLFLVIAAYIFFIPLFRPFEFIFPFLIVVFFALVEQPGFLMAVFLSVLFYLLLGIKDLVFIDRKSNYEILAFLILFLMFIELFSHFAGWMSVWPFFFALAAGAVFFALAKGVIGECAKKDIAPAESAGKFEFVVSAVAAFIIWQLSWGVILLPLDYLYQSVVVFLASVVLMKLISDYFCGELNRGKILISFSFFLIIFVLILGLAQWGL